MVHARTIGNWAIGCPRAGRRAGDLGTWEAGDLRGQVGGVHGRVGHLDATLRLHLLDIPDAEGEAEVEPSGQPDDVPRKPVKLEGDRRHEHPSVGRASLPCNRREPGVRLTAPAPGLQHSRRADWGQR